MGVSLFGVSVTTKIFLEPTGGLLWCTQIIIATFFMSGVISHYQQLHAYATNHEKPKARRLLARVMLVVMSAGVGSILHMMGYSVGINTMMFMNLGLFLMLIPIFDTDINWFEVSVRVAILGLFWSEYNVGFMQGSRYPVSLLMIAGWLVFARLYGHQDHPSAIPAFLLLISFAIGFWVMLPPFSAPSDRLKLQVNGIIMFIALAIITIYLWMRRYRARLRNIELEQIASYDQLTNAGTYAQYQSYIVKAFKAAKAEQTPFTMVSVDIDHFKQINDYYGHLAGNAVLIGAATTLDDVLSRSGLPYYIYRTGGEEFSILFPDASPDDVLPTVKACWKGVRKGHYTYKNQDIAVTISMGVTAIAPTDMVVDDIIKRADDNLYLSKHAGRDTITVEGETLYARTDRELVMAYIYFTQPIISAQNEQRYRNELLLRMYDHERERWVLPDMFDISVDTQINLMQRTLAQTSTRRISVNLTTAQFSDLSVAQRIVDFAKSKEGPDELTVEITDVPELNVMRDVTALYRTGRVRVMIDDVGSDNSYEVVNKLLPYVDGVKFAMQNLRRTQSAVLMEERVAFWAQIAKENDLTFVLEGIESKEEFEHYRDQYGVDLFQGYYFSKPALPRL